MRLNLQSLLPNFVIVDTAGASTTTSAPELHKERNRSWKFKWLQRRRGQTEARVSIIKHVFLGGRVRTKGFKHRERTVTWGVLVHNLWVLAGLEKIRQPEAQARAA